MALFQTCVFAVIVGVFPGLVQVLLVEGQGGPPGHAHDSLCLKGDKCNGKATDAGCDVGTEQCAAGCTCGNGYLGVDCTGPPVCTTNRDCNGHGMCNNFLCECSDGWTGTYCEEPPLCTASGGECGPNGECDAKCHPAGTINTPYRCLCRNGYAGKHCDVEPICGSHKDCGKFGMCNYDRHPYYCTCSNRFCYYVGGTSDAATGILNAITKPMSYHKPVEKICEGLKEKDSQICELKYEKQIDLSTVDLKKLKVKDLKKILEQWDESAACKGCMEKSEYIKAIQDLMPKYAPEADKKRKQEL